MVHADSVVAMVISSISQKWVWTDDFPTIALAELRAFIVAHRSGAMQELLDVTAGEKHDSAGFTAGALPGLWDVAREEAGRRDAFRRRRARRGLVLHSWWCPFRRERPHPALPRETDHVHFAFGARARSFGD